MDRLDEKIIEVLKNNFSQRELNELYERTTKEYWENIFASPELEEQQEVEE